MNIEKYGYRLWTDEPNSIAEGGRVFIKTVHVNVKNKDKDRLIRIYLPSTYDFDNPNKRFPVIYMMDGKNLYDDYTSFVGEWGVDETIEEAIKEGKTDGIIVVGIDSAKTDLGRTDEMTPCDIEQRDLSRHHRQLHGYAHILGDYIFNELKPEIDKVFYTLPEKEHTGVGGSSMGGLMAYYLYKKYKEYVGHSLSFSPAFFLFKKNALLKEFNTYITNPTELGRIYFYVGGVGFEKMFVKPTELAYQHFLKVGFNKNQVKYVQDASQEHNERAWRIYFPDALEFCNYLK